MSGGYGGSGYPNGSVNKRPKNPYAQSDSADPLQLGGGQGPSYDPQAARDVYAQGNQSQNNQSLGADPFRGGTWQPSGASYGGFTAGGAGGGPTSSGSRVGSVNYNAFGNLSNLISQDPQAASQLRAMGMMPTYNGQDVDQAMAAGPNGGVHHYVGGGVSYAQGSLPEWIRSGGTASSWPGASGGMGGQGGAGGLSGTPGTGLPLEGQIEGGYGNLIANGGNVLNPTQEAGLVNQSQDAIAHGQQDALQSARLDAIRRGDTSGSTLGSREDQIRMGGAAAQAKQALATQTGLRQESGNRLLGALGGATGMYGHQLGNLESLRQLALLQGQQGQGNIQALMNLK